MGLTLVTDEKTGESRYEYLEEDQKKPVVPTVSTRSIGETLSDLSPITEGLKADEDDDLLTGTIKTAGRIPYNAAVNTLQEGSDTIRDLGEYFGIAPEGTGTTFEEQDKGIIGLGDWKPVEADNSEANFQGVESFATGITQFVAEWMLLSRALRGANWALKGATQGTKVGKLGTKIGATALKTKQAIKGTAVGQKATAFASTPFGKHLAVPLARGAWNATANPKGLAVDFAAFNQWDGRLYDLAANSEWFGFVQHIPLVNQLASDPDDTAVEGRLKNMVEGWAIDFGIGSAWQGYKARPKDSANLITQVTKAQGYAQQLFENVRKFGEDSPQAQAIREKLDGLSKKVSRNPIVRQLENVPEGMPDAETAFNVKQIDNELKEVDFEIEKLGPEPPKPAPGRSFEVVDGKKKKTQAAKDHAKWSKKNQEITKRREGVIGQRNEFIPEEPPSTNPRTESIRQEIKDLGPEPELPTPPEGFKGEGTPAQNAARDSYDAQLREYNSQIRQREVKQARIDNIERPAPDPGVRTYSREQIEEADQIVRRVTKNGRPISGEEVEVLRKQLLERKFGRLNRHGVPDSPFTGDEFTNEQVNAWTRKRIELVLDIVRKIGGKDILERLKLHPDYGITEAAEGYKLGGGEQPVLGSYDFFDDVLDIYGIAEGSLEQLGKTAYHELWHRVQQLILSDDQIKILDTKFARYRANFTKSRIISRLRDEGIPVDNLSYLEIQGYIAQEYGWARREGKSVTVAMALKEWTDDPFIRAFTEAADHIFDVIEKFYNFLTDPKGKGFRSMRSIYEEFAQGKLKADELMDTRWEARYEKDQMKNPELSDFDSQKGSLDDILGDVGLGDVRGYYGIPSYKTLRPSQVGGYTGPGIGLANAESFIESPWRQMVQPGGIWRTRDEGYRKLSKEQFDALDFLGKKEQTEIGVGFLDSKLDYQIAPDYSGIPEAALRFYYSHPDFPDVTFDSFIADVGAQQALLDAIGGGGKADTGERLAKARSDFLAAKVDAINNIIRRLEGSDFKKGSIADKMQQIINKMKKADGIEPGADYETPWYFKGDPDDWDPYDFWTGPGAGKNYQLGGGKRFAGDFNFPPGNYPTNYGQAKITFESDLDRVAWILRKGKAKLPKSAQKLIDALEEQGHNIEDVRALGDEIHEQIKTGIESATGSAKAGPNTRGVELEVPASTFEEGFDEVVDATQDAGQGKTVEEWDEILEETKAEQADVPGTSKYEVESAEVTDTYLEDLEKFSRGEIDLDELFNDVIAVESPSGRRSYGPATTDMLLLWDAVGKRLDRIQTTGMPSVDSQALMDQIVLNAEKYGINAAEIEGLNKVLAANLSNNVDNVKNLLKLRVLVTKTSEVAGVKAMKLLNAMKDGRINWEEAASELQHSVLVGVRTFRLYQTITRGAGQLLASTQAQIPDLANVKFTEGDVPGFKIDAEGLIKEIETADNALPEGDSLKAVFPVELQTAIKTKEWTPQSKAMLTEFARVVSDEATNPGVGIGTIDKLMRGPNPSVNQIETAAKGAEPAGIQDTVELWGRTLSTYRISNLLSSPLTYAIQTGVPTARMVLEPAYYVLDATLTRPEGSWIPFDAQAFQQKLPIAYVWYKQMWMQSMGALRLGKKAFMEGHTLYDPYRRSSAWDLNTYRAVQEAEGMSERMILDETNPAYNLNEFPLAKEIGKSPAQIALKNFLWKAATIDLRLQGAIETTQKALAGNSFLYAIGVEEGLEQAAREGLSGGEAWYFAEEWAKSKVQFFTHDAVVRGVTINDAINTHPAALKMGRMLTFTDDVRALMPARTIDFGQDLARNKGIKDEGEINAFAKKYKEGYVDRHGNTHETPLNEPGTPTPSSTAAWSFLPEKWTEIQRKRYGWIATMIQPFNRSPGDMTKQAIRMLPFSNRHVDTAYRDFLDETSYFAKRWKGEVATGATIMMAMSSLYANDNIQITGSGPTNPDAYAKWRTQNQPDSIRFKTGIDELGNATWGEWTSYRAYEPASSIIRGFADYWQIAASLTKEQRETLAQLLPVQIAAQAFTGRFRTSYYEGIADFVDVIMSIAPTGGAGKLPTQPGSINKVQRYLAKLAASFVYRSAHLRTVTQALDEEKRTNPRGGRRKVVDQDSDTVFQWPGDKDTTARDIPYTETGSDNPFVNIFNHVLQEIQAITPLWSKDLPARRNWITFDPLLNPGFLGDNYLPTEDEPMLAQLTSAFVLTALPAPISAIPLVGAHPDVVGRKGRKDIGKKDYVMNELMRIHGFGSRFIAPSPTDLQKGVTLSAPAYEQYLRYIADTPDPRTGRKLYEELYRIMATPTYQRQLPEARGKSNEVSPRMALLQPVFEQYRKQGRFMFLNDKNNPYILEVLELRHQQNKGDAIRERMLQTGEQIPVEQVKGSNDTVSPSEYVATLN